MLKEQAPLYLIDGFAIIFKSYYAMIRNPLTNQRGENVSALLGFVKQVQQILRHAQKHSKAHGSSRVAMLLDSGAETFRHEIFPEYKANRDAAPEDLVVQLGYLDQLLQHWGIPSYKSPGYEADDLIASLAHRARNVGMGCYIVSGDKDLYQLINENTSVLRLDKGEEHRESYVEKKWGVRVEQLRDYLALTGDSADNIPGVKGVGPKRACELLSRYQSLADIYQNLAEVQPLSLRRKLEESQERAKLSYQLVGLDAEVPIITQPGWEQLLQELVLPAKACGEEPNPEFSHFLEDLGLHRLAQEFAPSSSTRNSEGNSQVTGPEPEKLGQSSGQNLLERQRLALQVPGQNNELDSPQTDNTQALNKKSPQQVSQNYECVLSEGQLRDWCERIRQSKIVAIDTETTGLDEMADKLVGISLSTAKNQACYIPLRVNEEGIDQHKLLSDELVRRMLNECLSPEIRVIGQNFKFDYKILCNWGLKVPNIYFDTMIAAWLLDSSHPVGMDALAVRYLGIEPIHFKDLLPKTRKKAPKKTLENKEHAANKPCFADVPLTLAVQYAAEDADITWQLYETLAPKLEQQGLSSLFFELEMPLLRILGNMELRGIGCERSELESYSAELKKELEKLEEQVQSLSEETFNLNSPQQLSQVLFDKLRLPAGKKTKTGYSTDNSILEKLRHQHPIIAPLLEYRRLNKLYSTYVKALPQLIQPTTKRIHTHFSLIGAETGRLSSKDPNLQNIPVKDAAGRRIRRAFQPKPGWGFFSADYSQIELVVLAHLCADPGLCRSFEQGTDIHRQTASELFAIPSEAVNDDQRRIAKSINFGVIYGMSAFRLSQDLGIPRNAAKGFIDTYFRKFSHVQGFITQTLQKAEQQGFVETLSGRRREIRQLRSNNKIERSHGERMAVNTVVQGSAADIVKRAMILLDAEFAKRSGNGWQSRLLLQVHDELIFEAPLHEKEALESLVLDVMENAWELEVPLRVVGEWSSQSWGELH